MARDKKTKATAAAAAATAAAAVTTTTNSPPYSSLLGSFSPDGELFASVSGPLVKVWHTRSGGPVGAWEDLIAETDILHSCISCCYAGEEDKKDEKPCLVALGMSSGDVLVINFPSMRRWVNKDCHSGVVVGIHFSKDGRTLYTAGADGIVCELNSETGESNGTFKASKRPITSLTISHDGNFIGVSSKTTKFFSLSDKKEILKMPSDLGTIKFISVSNDGKIAISYVDGNEELQIWSCDHQIRSITPRAKLPMQNQPQMIECGRSSLYNEGAIVLSVSKKGIAYVWHLHSLSQDEVRPTKILVKSSVQASLDVQKDGKKGRVPIISAKLCAKEDNGIAVHITYGSPDALQFKHVKLDDTGKDIKLVADSDALIAGHVMTTFRENMEQDVKGNGGEIEEHGLQEKRSASQKGSSKKRRTSDLDPANEMTNEANAQYNSDEPTMEEKLASLNLLNNDNERGDTEESSPLVRPPSADSVHVLLKQALRADDRSLLLDCLYNRDEKVIAKSISLLTPADVLKLLKSFIFLIQSRGAILVCVLPWLESLLSQQASSIVSQESSLLLLNSLYQLIDSRTSTLKSALQLSTSLDYLFTRIADDEVDEEETAPPIIYEDKDTDEDGSEDAMETDEVGKELGDVTDGSEIMSD